MTCTHPVDDGAVLKKNRCTLESKDPLIAVKSRPSSFVPNRLAIDTPLERIIIIRIIFSGSHLIISWFLTKNMDTKCRNDEPLFCS